MFSVILQSNLFTMKTTAFLFFSFLSTSLFAQQLVAEYRPSKSSEFGYISPTGEEILPPIYKETTIFEDGYALVFEAKLKKWKFIDIQGNELKIPYESFVPKSVFGIGEHTFKDGLAYITVNKKAACINSKGEAVHPAEYDEMSRFKNGYAIGQQGTNFFILKPDGSTTKIQAPANHLDDFSENLAPFRTAENKWGYVATDGTVSIQAKFNKVGYFHNGLAWAKNELDKIGFINNKGEWVIQPTFDKVTDFDSPEKISIAKTAAGEVLLKMNGETIAVDGVTDIKNFNEGLAAARSGGTWGFINAKGEWLVKPSYTDVKPFSAGFANVRIGELWGAIDKTGKVVVPVEYTKIGDLSDGLIEVRQGEFWGFCDASGKLVIPIQFRDVRAFHFGYAVASTPSGLWGIIDKTGKWSVEAKYFNVKDVNQLK